MRDKVTAQRVLLLHPKVRAEVTAGIEKAEAGLGPRIAIRIAEGLRTIEYQDGLYAQGRTKPGPIVTNARGGSSNHNYGLAFDFCLLYDNDGNGTFEELSWSNVKDGDKDGIADWMEVVKIFIALGWRWGADWDQDGLTKAQGDKDEHLVDTPHLEKTFGRSVTQLLALYKAKNFILGTTYVVL